MPVVHESDPEQAAQIKAQAEADKAAGVGLLDGQHPIADYSFAHGGSYTGPTQDVDGAPLAEGDAVQMLPNHDRAYGYYDGAVGEVHQVQDVFPFAQVTVVFPNEPRLGPISTWSQNVRKVATDGTR